MNDHELLRAYADRRDQAAFTAVIERHGAMVRGTCRRICGDHEAEDAAQAAFLVLAEKARAVAAHPSPAAWLHRTATQVAMRAKRDSVARARREREAGPMLHPRGDGGAAVTPELDPALASLPAAYRQALVAHYLEGRAAPTLAAELGVSPEALAMRLSRGRELLRRALARRGVALAGAALLLALENAGSAAETAAIPTTASAGASALARAHLRGALRLARIKLAGGCAAAMAALVVATIAIHPTNASTPIRALLPPSSASPLPTTFEPPSAVPVSTSGDAMDITIIDRPFARTLYGVVGQHEPGKPYGPEIIALLNQVWAAVGAAKIRTTGINHVRYYADGTMFAGVEVPGDAGTLALERREIAFTRYAYYKHVGFYAKIADSTKRLLDGIERRGLKNVDGGLEIYGHNNPDESKAETELLYPVK